MTVRRLICLRGGREVIAAATVAESPAKQKELILSLKLKLLPEAVV
jgi:hypothetical protein